MVYMDTAMASSLPEEGTLLQDIHTQGFNDKFAASHLPKL